MRILQDNAAYIAFVVRFCQILETEKWIHPVIVFWMY
jgi:hypothetical protein